MPVPVGTMFIGLCSFSKCVPAPRPCALYRRKETCSSGHTRKRMRNTLSRRHTEAHRASSEERDGVFPHTHISQKIVRYTFSERECDFLQHSLIFQSCSIDSQRRLLLLFVCSRCPHRTPKILFVLQDCDCTPGIFKIAFGLLWDLQSQKSAFSPLVLIV